MTSLKKIYRNKYLLLGLFLKKKTNKKKFSIFFPHLVQNKVVQIRHVALVGQRSFVIISKMLFKGNGVVRDLHHCAEVM